MENPPSKRKFEGTKAGSAKSNGNGGILKKIELAEIFAMDEVTHYNRLGSDATSSCHGCQAPESLFDSSNRGHFSYNFGSDDDEDDSEILPTGDKETLPTEMSSGSVGHDYNLFTAGNKVISVDNGSDQRPGASEAGSCSNAFVIDVKRADVMLDSFVFFIICAEFSLDVSIAVSHYHYGMKWAAGLTWLFIILGAASILHQFNYMEKGQIKALFDGGKRIGILISCFPPLGTILCSYQCVVIGIKSTQDPMISSRYLEIENFSKNLYKRQSFFQAAPQAALQMIIFIVSLDSQSVSFGKGVLSLMNIMISIIVMTNSSIPSKAENLRYQIYKSPSQRMFIGIRMFSSFASRIMAVTSLFVGLRCLAGSAYILNGALVALTILLLPRMIFTLVEFARQLVLAQGPGSDPNIPHLRLQASLPTPFSCTVCQQILFGYLATILFPVGDPIWVFWYISTESAIFVLSGNVSGWSLTCLSNIVNSSYTIIFLVLFIIVPMIVPYVKDSAKRMQVRRMQKLVHESAFGSFPPD